MIEVGAPGTRGRTNLDGVLTWDQHGGQLVFSPSRPTPGRSETHVAPGAAVDEDLGCAIAVAAVGISEVKLHQAAMNAVDAPSSVRVLAPEVDEVGMVGTVMNVDHLHAGAGDEVFGVDGQGAATSGGLVRAELLTERTTRPSRVTTTLVIVGIEVSVFEDHAEVVVATRQPQVSAEVVVITVACDQEARKARGVSRVESILHRSSC